jgi:hypothetical protein
MVRGLNCGKKAGLCRLQNVQATDSGTHKSLLRWVTSSFLGDKRGRSVKLPTHLDPVLMLRRMKLNSCIPFMPSFCVDIGSFTFSFVCLSYFTGGLIRQVLLKTEKSQMGKFGKLRIICCVRSLGLLEPNTSSGTLRWVIRFAVLDVSGGSIVSIIKNQTFQNFTWCQKLF